MINFSSEKFLNEIKNRLIDDINNEKKSFNNYEKMKKEPIFSIQKIVNNNFYGSDNNISNRSINNKINNQKDINNNFNPIYPKNNGVINNENINVEKEINKSSSKNLGIIGYKKDDLEKKLIILNTMEFNYIDKNGEKIVTNAKEIPYSIIIKKKILEEQGLKNFEIQAKHSLEKQKLNLGTCYNKDKILEEDNNSKSNNNLFLPKENKDTKEEINNIKPQMEINFEEKENNKDIKYNENYEKEFSKTPTTPISMKEKYIKMLEILESLYLLNKKKRKKFIKKKVT